MLELLDLHRRFGATAALDGLTATFRPGSLVGFLGPNGAGKTTSMRLALGLDQPDGGEVRWNGAPIGRAELQRTGYLPEERGLYPKMRLADQIELLACLHGLDRGEARRRADGWLERVGLADRRDDQIQKLSLGNQQRVQLVAALVHEPDLLLLDEPFSGLDPIGTDLMRDLLEERAHAGATVVFSSHQLDLVEHLCEEVVIINRGRHVLSGPVDRLRRSGPTRLAVGAAEGWLPTVPGTRVLPQRSESGHLLVELEDGVDPQAVLADAQAAGPITHFAEELASLSEVFRRAVAA